MVDGQKQRRRLEALHRHAQFKTALELVRRLRDQGYQAVFAGGCVRDSLLGRKLKDIDIASSATPDVIEKLFERTLAVGKAFGTMVVIQDGHSFEVTTFRRDGPYVDGRHPDHVEFTDIAEDARRRDFTVNALFYDPLAEEVLDFVGGLTDLKSHCLRTVGQPEERFHEDRLRMLRAARFVAQLGFALDVRTLAAIQHLAPQLKSVSSERIQGEMKHMLESRFLSQGLNVLRLSGLHSEVWPEISDLNLSRLHDFSPFIDWTNAFAAVTWLAGAPDAEPRLRAWKVSKDVLRSVQAQIDGARILLDTHSSLAAKVKILGGAEFAHVLILAAGASPSRLDDLQGVVQKFLKIAPGGRLPAPLINGQDLMAAGVVPGEKMGQILKSVYDAQLEGRVTSKSQALKLISI